MSTSRTHRLHRREFTRLALGAGALLWLPRAVARNPRGMATGGSAGYTFDYFISPHGDDVLGNGSLGNPWSITALNSKQATYSGKKVGLIGDVAGVQTPYTYGTANGVQTTLLGIGNANGNQPVLNTNGGTAAASTVIASCNSSGVYTPRWAIIDFGSPTNQTCFGMGQNDDSSTQVPKPGYITFDGLTVRNFSFSAICTQSNGGAALHNVQFINNEVYNGGGVPSTNNPGAIRMIQCISPLIHNNKVHDLATIAGGGSPRWGHNAFMTYGLTSPGTMGIICTNNMTYNCSSFLTKDGFQDFANCSYNYFDHGNFGSAASTDGAIGQNAIVSHCPASGVISDIHHNILLGSIGFWTETGSNTVAGTGKIHNNTLYGTPNYPLFDALYCKNEAAGAAMQFFNNIVYSDGSPAYDQASTGSCIWVDSGYAIANATFDKNVYGSNGNGVKWSRAGEDQALSFATWKATYSVDANSVQVASSPFTGTPTAQVPSSFAVNSSAIIGGVTCGALDGSGTVGPSF